MTGVRKSIYELRSEILRARRSLAQVHIWADHATLVLPENQKNVAAVRQMLKEYIQSAYDVVTVDAWHNFVVVWHFSVVVDEEHSTLENISPFE